MINIIEFLVVGTLLGLYLVKRLHQYFYWKNRVKIHLQIDPDLYNIMWHAHHRLRCDLAKLSGVPYDKWKPDPTNIQAFELASKVFRGKFR